MLFKHVLRFLCSSPQLIRSICVEEYNGFSELEVSDVFPQDLLTAFLPCHFSVSSLAQHPCTNPAAPGGSISPNLNSSAARSNASFGPGEVSAPTADREGKVKFHLQSILIQVPIVVTNKAGNHIHGLTKDDVHVLENGKEQKISTFEEITATNTKLSAITSKPGEFSNLALSDQQPRNVTVIALDTINTPFLDQANGRRELIKFWPTISTPAR